MDLGCQVILYSILSGNVRAKTLERTDCHIPLHLDALQLAVMSKRTTLVMTTGLVLYLWEYHRHYSAGEWHSLGSPLLLGSCGLLHCRSWHSLVISQIAFMISFMSKAKTIWTVWEFALKRAPVGWYRGSYKSFDPSATAVEVLH